MPNGIQIDNLRTLSARMLARKIDYTSQNTIGRGDGILTQEELAQYGEAHGFSRTQISNSWKGLQKNAETMPFIHLTEAKLDNMVRGVLSGISCFINPFIGNLFNVAHEVVAPNLVRLGIFYAPVSAVINSLIEYRSTNEIPMISINQHIAAVALNTLQDAVVTVVFLGRVFRSSRKEAERSIHDMSRPYTMSILPDFSKPNPISTAQHASYFNSLLFGASIFAFPAAGYITQKLTDGLLWLSYSR